MKKQSFALILFLGFSFTLLQGGCATIDAPGLWTNGFTAQTSGFDQVAIFTDYTVRRTTPKDKTFIALKDSLEFARKSDETVVRILTAKGYKVGASARFFIGGYCVDSQPVSFADARQVTTRTPPFHIDPDIERVPDLAGDLHLAFQLFSEMVVGGENAARNASLPADLTKRIAGNYRSTGIVLVIGQLVINEKANEEDIDKPRPQAARTLENFQDVRTPLIAVGYFEGMTGKLVFMHSETFPDSLNNKTDKEIKTTEKTLLGFHADFPFVRVGGRFDVPPPPKMTTARDIAAAMPLQPDAYYEQDMTSENFFAIVRMHGGVPFFDRPIPNRPPLKLLPSGAKVNVLGRKPDYFKVMLSDGYVGWIPADALWIKK